MHPEMHIHVEKLSCNATYLFNICHEQGISVAAVMKLYCGDKRIAELLLSSGADFLADSRLRNLKELQNFECEKMLLRIPMLSEAVDVVRYADMSLNSELDTVRMLDREAGLQDKRHQIILMADLGDLREGYLVRQDFLAAVAEIIKMENVVLSGIGTNLTCYGGVIPTAEKLAELVDLSEIIRNDYGVELDIISGGASSSLPLLFNKEIPAGINNLRLGYAVAMGREGAYYKRIPGTYDDVFTLHAEIIELKEKPSVPIGEIGVNSFFEKPVFVDKGIRKRAICAIGKQDVDFDDLYPIDSGIEIIGGSSDHMLVDVSDSEKPYRIGDVLSFRMDYVSALRAMTSRYVTKKYID